MKGLADVAGKALSIIALILLLHVFGFYSVQFALAQQNAFPSEDAYSVFSGDGDPADLATVIEAADTIDVVLVGEVHRDPTAHELAAELASRLARQSTSEPALALSLEMFERDVQPVLDEYLSGLITEEHFLSASRPWPGYENSYRPLVERARAEGWPVIAANAPRRYANLVAREGISAVEKLPTTARTWLPPLPYAGPSPEYRRQWLELMREAAHPNGEEQSDPPSDTGEASPHSAAQFEPMLQAQALWDASMAHAIARQLIRTPDTPVMHLSGAFHVEYGTGIVEHLRRYRPGTRALLITIRPEEAPLHFAREAHLSRADFVILTDQERLRAAGDDS